MTPKHLNIRSIKMRRSFNHGSLNWMDNTPEEFLKMTATHSIAKRAPTQKISRETRIAQHG